MLIRTLEPYPHRVMADSLDKNLLRQPKQSFVSRIAYAVILYPIELSLSLVSSVLRPIAPQLIPLAVFFLLVPSLVIPAIVSGLYVWYSRAISWQSPLFFQYGCVLVYYQEPLSTHVPRATACHHTLRLNSSHLILPNLMTYLSTSLSLPHRLTMILGTS
jgi:hypothetical protein